MRNLKPMMFLLAFSLVLPSIILAADSDNSASDVNTVLTKKDSTSSDSVIEARLQTAYSLNVELSRFNIKVSAKDGIVNLGGAVQSDIQKELAASIAKDMEGVQDVTNNIVIDKNTRAGEKQGDFGQKVIDSTITAMVKSKLLADPRTSGLGITVTTINNVVTLTGLVSSATEREIAGRLALKTTGVSAVKNNLKIDRTKK